MADVTINQLPDLAVSGGNFLAHTNGSTTGKATISQLAATAIPTGVIVMWSGAITSVPSGWQLCDGSNGTPDLRNRFIVGAGNSYSTGSTGGNNSVTPSGSIGSTSLSVAQLPAHSHTGVIVGGSSSRCSGAQNTSRVSSLASGSTASVGLGQGHSHTLSMNSQNNLPPYYALAYIMKL